VLANGVIVADGTGAQIKASVAGRTISAVIPGVGTAEVGALPGVVSTEQQASRLLLHCNDSDAALRAMLAAFPAAHDIEIAAGNLEDAFLELTAASRLESNR
jgi:ABC-2 type transport system ATP-binding protein